MPLAQSGRHPWVLCFQAIAYALWGKASEARAAHNELLARAARGYVQPSLVVLSAVAIGEIEDAVALAQTGYEERDVFQIVTWHFPTGVDLRAVPRIQAIFDRVDTPDS